ncbi:MAG: GNAT family N-acetyltransferase [Deltaproteobacteria bacterium]|nr:GNAT family N-acetyltransferase [Deltaproteobacteria bacterium]
MDVEKIFPDSCSIEAILRNGQSLRLRPIRPDDKKRLKDLFYRQSPRTRYLRFQYAKEHITDEELKHFTEVTPPDRYAFVATIGEGPGERIVAVSRWDSISDGKKAEVAFAVEDNIQLKGIGTLLLEELARVAVSYNIFVFEASVLAENTRMLEVFEESGFKLRKNLDSGVYRITIDLKDQEEYAKRQAYREHVARRAGVLTLLKPRRVAVVGASRNPESVGGALLRNLLKDGFSGAVFPVNPNAESVAGVLAYPTVLDVPGDLDMAVIAVPAEKVLEVVDQCAKKEVMGMVIVTAGFKESGPDGAVLEKRLKEKILSYGIRVIGPNCLGILNNSPNTRLNATFSPVTPAHGNLSIGSQSGALGLALLDHAKSINLGIASFVSFGNRIDISNNDLLEYWEDDEDTGVVALYMESFGNPRKFGRIARRVSHKKPIIAVKAGRSRVGARAATSHTGALAASDIAVDALFRESGVIRVTTIEEMFDAAEVLASQPLPGGPGVAILTNAGGPGVLAADACESLGLTVPQLSPETQKRLREFLPKAAAVANPVDMIATAPAESFKRSLSIILEDDSVDSVIVIYIPPLVTRPEDVAQALKEAVSDYRWGKPVIPCFMMSKSVMLDLRKKSNIRSFLFPENAVQALSIAYNYSRFRDEEEGAVIKSPVDSETVRKKFLGAGKTEKGWVMPEEAMGLFKEYGIRVAETSIAFSAEEAVKAATGLAFPLVMKVRSTKIIHKSDIGGIVVGIKDTEEVRKAFDEITGRVKAAGRSDEMQGVVLQPMTGGGHEMIIGMSVDPLFGPLVMIGSGGVNVELIRDIAFSIHPLTDVAPERMLKQLKTLPLLKGWRGKPPADIEALKGVLLKFSAIIEDFPEIEQMEINPLIVLSEGRGAVAVDARVYLKGS